MDNKNVLILGGGGREHAIYKALKACPGVGKLFIAPGNGGIKEGRVDLNPSDFEAVYAFCQKENIELVVPGPEQPLVEGVTDFMQSKGIRCFGPSGYCAQMEGSKNFAKEVMDAAGVPTAEYKFFTGHEQATAYLAGRAEGPVVVKADGLAAGKGVTVAQNKAEAQKALGEIFEGKAFGDQNAVIEDFLTGEEASLFALCDGKTALPMLPAQDHKQVGEGDRGPNTGGMGAYAPAPILDAAMVEQVRREVLQPVVDYLKEQGHPYHGVLYAGLMIDKSKGKEGLKVLEFNCRFGDPETQIILPALKNNLFELMWQCAGGELKVDKLDWHNESLMTVVLAAPGYPGSYPKSIPLELNSEWDNDRHYVIHAGTEKGESQNGYLSTGGRVLNVIGRGKDLSEAKDNAYQLVDLIGTEALFCRRDIGFKAL